MNKQLVLTCLLIVTFGSILLGKRSFLVDFRLSPPHLGEASDVSTSQSRVKPQVEKEVHVPARTFPTTTDVHRPVSTPTASSGSPWPQLVAPDPPRAKVLKEVIDGSQSTGACPADRFVSRFRSVTCGAVASNMCFARGQPTFFADASDPHVLSSGPQMRSFTSSGAVTMCNEAVRGKKRLPMHLRTPEALAAAQQGVGASGAGPEACSRRVLIAAMCWEMYGYHLILCLMATFAHLQRLGLPAVMAQWGGPPPHSARLTVVMVKSAGVFPYMVGSPLDWNGTSRADAAQLPSRASPSPYWPLWRLLADSPADVFAVPDLPPTCFWLSVLGSPASPLVTVEEGQAFRQAAIARLGLRPRTVLGNASQEAAGRAYTAATPSKPFTPHSERLITCRQYRVVLVQRHKRYRILNLPEVEGAIARAFGGALAALRTVVLENMTMMEQMDLFVNTDALIGVHGNGLSWSFLMPRGGALLELWPNYPYNTNFKKFAERAGLFHASVGAKANCKNRCPASYTIPPPDLAAVRAHLDRTAC